MQERDAYLGESEHTWCGQRERERERRWGWGDEGHEADDQIDARELPWKSQMILQDFFTQIYLTVLFNSDIAGREHGILDMVVGYQLGDYSILMWSK